MTDRLRRFIAWWQIVCGVLGLAMFAAMFMDWLPGGRALLENTVGWINYYVGIGFFSFTVAAGRSLLRGERWGLVGSALCQAAQIVAFAILHGPHVQIAAGPTLGVAVSSSGAIRFSAGFNSAFFLGTRLAGPGFEASINFIAASWAMLLWKEARRTRGGPKLAAA